VADTDLNLIYTYALCCVFDMFRDVNIDWNMNEIIDNEKLKS
jgi:hypothetical protein